MNFMTGLKYCDLFWRGLLLGDSLLKQTARMVVLAIVDSVDDVTSAGVILKCQTTYIQLRTVR
jgi:hypothetical protein